MGMPKENVFVMNIGDVLEIDKKSAKINGTVTAGQVLVDGLGVGDIGSVVLRDRKILSEDGLIVVVIATDSNSGTLLKGPNIITRGFVYVKESEELISGARRLVANALRKINGNINEQWPVVKNLVRDTLNKYIWQNTGRHPMILPVVVDV